MSFRFSARSRKALVGVHPDLVRLAERALGLSPVDFVVTEGLRTEARQRELVAAGASRTLDSRHITGHAIDVAAWLGEIRWDFGLYVQIAIAFRDASKAERVPVRCPIFVSDYHSQGFTASSTTSLITVHLVD